MSVTEPSSAGELGRALHSFGTQAALLEAACEPRRDSDPPIVNGAPDVAGFEIISRLGAGSSGEVWLANELETGRIVALKILHRSGADRTSEELLQREFRVLAKLIHPNLVLLYRGIVTSDGQQGFAMEWIDGWPLDEWLESHPDLTLKQMLVLFRGMTGGVAFLHDHGVIHRDLKPANVIVDSQGLVKIVDFGLARLHQEETAAGSDGGSIGVSGTLHFMAPEQAANGKGSRSMPVDVYALGLMLYRILTGEWLHPKDGTPAETLALVLNPPPLVLRGPGLALPQDLQSILRQALAPDPARRYHHARDLEADLERFDNRQPVAAQKHTLFYFTATLLRRQARRSTLAAGLVIGGLVAGGAIYQRHRVVTERNEENLRDAYSLTSFTLRQLRDELHGSVPEQEIEPSTADLGLPGSSGGPHPALPVNAAGELDLRYYQAMLADLRSATSEGRSQYGPALHSIQPALDLFCELSREEPGDPMKLFDAAKARLSFARLLGKTGRTEASGIHARKTLGQLDRLAAWPGFDPTPLAPMRCDTLRLIARQAHHAGDLVEAVQIAREWISACEELKIRPEREWIPHLSLAASDLITYALSAGPSFLPEARQEIHQATEFCRVAYNRNPGSFPFACGLARCLHAKARLALHDGSGGEFSGFLEEASDLLIEHPADFQSSALPLVWEISVTATDWAVSQQEQADPTLRKYALALATRFTAYLRRSGDVRDEVLIQRARLYLLNSRQSFLSGRRDAAARQVNLALELLRPLQVQEPENTSLTLLTAAALHHLRSLADQPDVRWGKKSAAHLELLLEQLAARSDSFTPEQHREFDKLR